MRILAHILLCKLRIFFKLSSELSAKNIIKHLSSFVVFGGFALGAFVFACQMVNFAIPGTGSSGHLCGGLILAILLGGDAAFLVMACVLAVQALFFADGGLLALGCNAFNLGFLPAFVAYPLVYRPLAHGTPGRRRMAVAVMAAAVAGLAMGAGFVVLETVLSGISALPVAPFLLLMLPIHLAIGCVEGAVTLVLVSFIARTRPAAWSTRSALMRPAVTAWTSGPPRG